MADAIPISDPGLLAAQAKSGQDGVAAYNQAIASLQQQRQGAVQTALQEAAMRGSPAGAAESQSSIITGPYDQRIASLTQGLGSYEASMAGRDRRMADYNQATIAARSYIPQQVEMIVGPIRARGEFEVRNTQMEGQNRVAGINAETELTLAKMQAAFQAAQIAAAKKAAEKAAEEMKLNQSELGGLMTERGSKMLSGSADQIRQILAANEQATLAASQNAVKALKPAEDAARNQNYWDLMAARYTGRGLEEEKARPAGNAIQAAAAGGTKLPLPMQVPRGTAAVAQNTDEIIGYDRYSGRPIYAASGESPAGMVPGGPNASTSTNQAALAMWNTVNQNANRTRALAQAPSMISELASGVAQRHRQQGVNRLSAALGTFAENNAKYAYTDADTGRRVFATREQVEGLDPFAREMLMGGTQVQGINSLADFENVVMGSPMPAYDPNDPSTRPNKYLPQNQGTGSAYSSDVVRNAMIEVARKLQGEGYEIDEGQVAASMPDKIPSIYNLLAGRSDQPTSEDVYKAAEAERASAAKTEAAGTKAQDKADELEVASTLASQFGREPPSNLGSAVEVGNRIVDNRPSLDALVAEIQNIIREWDTTRGGIGPDQITTQLLQNPDIVANPDLIALIPTAIFMAGR